MSTVIRVENLGKKYTIAHQQREKYTALRDVLADGARKLAKRVISPFTSGTPTCSEEFWALRDVAFEIRQGDRIGIIGRNGAGKSTLLKILSRITEPTTGRVSLKGRVASLLEVGTGFHPELTGRENIFLNGAILGMGRAEIARKFDEIVAFAEVERFLDTPVKRYSSGMYVRLAFAVAAHLEPEILIVDEVLAVGDAQFQRKCLGRMEDVGREGRTVLFVSHNMQAVRRLCNRAILQDKGLLVADGSARDVIELYQGRLTATVRERVWDSLAEAPGGDAVRLHSIRLISKGNAALTTLSLEDVIDLEFTFWNLLSDVNLNLSIVVYDRQDICVFNSVSDPKIFPPGLIRGVCRIPPLLNENIYRVRLLIVKDASVPVLDIDEAAVFEIREVARVGNWYGSWVGVVRPKLDWIVEPIDTSAEVSR